MNNALINDCIEYIDDNVNDIIKMINKWVGEHKKEIKYSVLNFIYEYINPVPKHYICNYYSLSADGKVSINQTIKKFLNSEYIGYRDCHWYPTYMNKFTEDVQVYSCALCSKLIREHLNEHFKCELSEDEFWEIKDKFDLFDDIQFNSLLCDYMWGEDVLIPLRISSIKLKDVENKLKELMS